MKQTFDIKGMACAMCVKAVEKAVTPLEGMKEVNVSLIENVMTVEYDETVLSADKIIEAVSSAGYKASLPKAKGSDVKEKKELSVFWARFLPSLILLLPLVYFNMAGMMSWPHPADLSPYIQFVLAGGILIINRTFFKKGVMGVKNMAPGMDTLISLGAAAAFLYSTGLIIRNIIVTKSVLFTSILNKSNDTTPHSMYFFESAGMIFTLITLGKMLEANSKAHTMDAINALSDLTLGKITVIRDGEERTITSDAVRAKDIVYVREGERICADGTIIDGLGSVDKSALTGESVPEDVKAGDKVLSGSLCVSGFFKFNVEKAGEETTLYSIIRLVKEAAEKKAPIQQLADKISGYFVPVVTAISLITFIVWMVTGHGLFLALNFAISVLVISCPCALGLATPAAMMAGTGNAARHGILIRSSECLETAKDVDCVVLDKTGTLTAGVMTVTDVISTDEAHTEEYMIKASSLESGSKHPYAIAIRDYKEKNHSGEDLNVSDVENVPGGGLKGKIGGKEYYIGNAKFVSENGISLDDDTLRTIDKLSAEGKTVLLLAGESLYLTIALMDVIKEDSYKALSEFEKEGLSVILATGDNKITAEAIAKDLPVDRIYSEILPDDKFKIVEELQKDGKKVAMIGDGINDAPALVKADVGIAIGRGSDIAIDSGDFILMKDSLKDAAYALSLSKRTMKIIKENLFWAFFYNMIGIPIAAGVLFIPFGLRLTPAIAAACMSLSSLFVVTNALRLRK